MSDSVPHLAIPFSPHRGAGGKMRPPEAEDHLRGIACGDGLSIFAFELILQN